MDTEQRVLELLTPVVATLGVELVDVEFAGGTLRVVVDRPAGEPTEACAEIDVDAPASTADEKPLPPGVTTGQLAEVNRLVSPLLDQHDPIPGRYTLEVSSPGLERPLRKPDHYGRAVGEEVVVKLVPAAEVRRLKGRLAAVDTPAEGDTTLAIDVIEVDGVYLDEVERRSVALSDVASARTVFPWGPKPKPGGANAGGKKKKSTKTSSRPRGAR